MDDKRQPGRPPFKPTAEMRRQVSIAAGGGMTHEEIAIALAISEPTLRKHFEVELSVVALKRRQRTYHRSTSKKTLPHSYRTPRVIPETHHKNNHG